MKSALRIWLIQRLSAAVLALYSCFAPVYVWLANPGGESGWQHIFAAWPVRWASLVFVLALALHAWVGMHDILLDYVKAPRVRGLLHGLVIAWLSGCVLIMADILWHSS
ncbi:MAG: succinate dehydrogenase, hydrophobic membrane anchor protein [Sulfuriferula sp.]